MTQYSRKCHRSPEAVARLGVLVFLLKIWHIVILSTQASFASAFRDHFLPIPSACLVISPQELGLKFILKLAWIPTVPALIFQLASSLVYTANVPWAPALSASMAESGAPHQSPVVCRPSPSTMLSVLSKLCPLSVGDCSHSPDSTWAALVPQWYSGLESWFFCS